MSKMSEIKITDWFHNQMHIAILLVTSLAWKNDSPQIRADHADFFHERICVLVHAHISIYEELKKLRRKRIYTEYETVADVPESWVWGRANFQSGSRVLKRCYELFIFIYFLFFLHLWHTMWFHAEKLLKTLKFWKSLNSLYKSASRPQKWPKLAQKTTHSIAIHSNFWIGVVPGAWWILMSRRFRICMAKGIKNL